MSELTEIPMLGDEAQRFMAELDVRTPVTISDGAPVVTKLIGRRGPVDAGIVATVVDLIAGHFILRQGWPCGISTTEMTLNGLHRLHGPGMLTASVRLVSLTTNRGCVEIDLTIEGSTRGSAVSTAAFKLFRFEGEALGIDPPGPWQVGASTISLDQPLWERTGIRTDLVSGTARVDLRAEIANHVSSLQGGVTVALLEAAARTRTGTSELRSMTLSYLAQGRTGPFEATARLTGPDADVIVVEAVDLGNDDRPLAHAVFTAAAPDPRP